MTDLISKLADALVALNNASPRLPRKEQIEEVLRAALHRPMDELQRMLVDSAMLARFPAFLVTRQGTIAEIPTWTDTYLATQEQLVQAADDICAQRLSDDLLWRPIEGTRTAECTCGCGAKRYY